MNETIIGIDVIYFGETVLIGDNLDTNNIKAIAKMLRSDNIYTKSLQYGLDYNLYNCDVLIEHIGENIKTILYKTEETEIEATFIVIGTPKLLSIRAIYTGGTKIIGAAISKEEVEVTATYLTNIDGTLESIPIEDSLWEFYGTPVINNFNNGKIKIVFNNKQDLITISYTIPNDMYLLAWHEGFDVVVGQEYNKEDIRVYLVLDYDKSRRRLEHYEVDFINGYTVTEEGWNYFNVQYIAGDLILKQTFIVWGYIPHEPADRKFKVLYVNRSTHEKEDYTKEFTERFTKHDILYISWYKFLEQVNESGLYGVYLMMAPMHVGLSNRYAQLWKVKCINDNTLKARVLKSYLEEGEIDEEESGDTTRTTNITI